MSSSPLGKGCTPKCTLPFPTMSTLVYDECMSGREMTLGGELAAARKSKALSLRAAAGAAQISAAYLQKLEGDRVESPSPRVLQQLAEALEVPYPRLMKRAGYAMPSASRSDRSPLDRKLAATGLSDVEERAVAAFIDHLLEQRGP